MFLAQAVYALALANAFGIATANLLQPMPVWAVDLAKKFQPAMDFDKDSCYHVAARDPAGNYNLGMQVPSAPPPTDGPPQAAAPTNEARQVAPAENITLQAWSTGCRTPEHLSHSNAYVRRRCNHFWCAYVYGYYFEKDHGFLNAHRHDWEHVIVWTLHDQVFFVSTSAHGGYELHHKSQVRFQDSHPKIVYHLGVKGTHSMRLAEGNDDPVENHSGKWFMAPLVQVTYSEPWSNGLLDHNWGSAHPDVGARFVGVLKDSMPADAKNNEGFKPDVDENRDLEGTDLPDISDLLDPSGSPSPSSTAVNTPVESANAPVESANAPAESANAPVEPVNTPVESVKAPVEHAEL